MPRQSCPAALKVYETCAPGAITKVSVYALDGTEDVVWAGRDPTPSHRQMGVSVLTIRANYPVARVKIQLNSPAFPGWNEIDAVGLVDASGKTQWAAAASASSSFNQPNGAIVNGGGGPGVFQSVAMAPSPVPFAAGSPPRIPVAQIVARLEAEVRQTQKQYDELRKLLESSQAEIKALRAELDALKQKVPKAAP